MKTELFKEANQAVTENGGAAFATTGSFCLDLFSSIGALRDADDEEMTTRFLRAYAEDAGLAMKMLFYARDVRGGLGERRVFRTILHFLAINEPASVLRNLSLIPEYGRYDDVLCLLDTPLRDSVTALVRSQLALDVQAMHAGGEVSLLAKWLPSVNTSSRKTVRLARELAGALHMSERTYRKTLSSLRSYLDILENRLRVGDYTFDYAKQPSRAMLKYEAAFWRNDGARYEAFLKDVSDGRKELHTGTLQPYEIVRPILDALSGEREMPDAKERRSLDVTWNALGGLMDAENALAVVDGSGSMYWSGAGPMPEAVAMSLGIYFAERNRGPFHNQFITFSESPRLVSVMGRDIAEKVRFCASFNECANTNVTAVFDLILKAAEKNSLPQSDLPEKLYFITDMEFDQCTEDADRKAFEYAKRTFEAHGYRLPEVVFWNVASRSRQQPVTMNEQGVTLVSGASPQVFSMLKEGTLTPYAFMMKVLHSERYRKVVA